MTAPELAVTLDVGATKLAYGVVDCDGLREYDEVATPRGDASRLTAEEQTDYFLQAMGGIVLELGERYDAHQAGIGFNGQTRFNRLTQEAHIGELSQITREKVFMLGARLGRTVPELAEHGMSVLALGDVEAAAYGSLDYIQKLSPEEIVMYLNLGTGFNMEIIANGRSMRANGHPGEWGNGVYEMPDGSYVSWGSLMCGGGIAASAGRSTKELYSDNSENATNTWTKVGGYLAGFVAAQRQGLGADHIVIGGGMSVCKARFHEVFTQDLGDRLSALAVDCGSDRTVPEIYYVPDNDLHTVALRGAYRALRSRQDELVMVQHPDLAFMPPQAGIVHQNQLA